MQNRRTQEMLTFRFEESQRRESSVPVEENHHRDRRRGATEGDVTGDSRATETNTNRLSGERIRERERESERERERERERESQV